MSVDPERHTLTHTHSHARTHAGPSAAPPAPPRTFTPKSGPPGSRARCQVPADGFPLTQRARVGGQEEQRRQGLPTTPLRRSPHSPARRGKGMRRGCPGLLPLRRPSARGSARRVPPRHVGRAGGDAAGGRAGRGTRGGQPSCPAQPPAQEEPRPRVRPALERERGRISSAPTLGRAGILLGNLAFQLCARGESRRALPLPGAGLGVPRDRFLPLKAP